MKKLVAMVLALCLLMACVPAFATLTIPETVADVPGAVKPVMPAYTLTEAGDHYELIIDGVSKDQTVSCSIYGYDGYDDYDEVNLTWNAEGTALESKVLLDEAFSDSLELYCYIDKPDGSGYNSYSVNLKTGEMISVSDGRWTEDGDAWYHWYEEDNSFSYRYATDEGGYVEVMYNTASGNVRSYSLEYSSGLNIYYNRYGQITGGNCMDAEGNSCYWDSYSKQWYNGDTGESNDELPALTLDEYPAPYAIPYVLYKPSENLADLDTTEGDLYELEDGSCWFSSETIDAIYNADGKLVSYSYGNLEGTKYVTYDANDVLLDAMVHTPDGACYYYDAELGWFYEDGDELVQMDSAPEGVTLDDMKPLKDPVSTASKVQYTWYDNNTVGLVGLSLRDMGITDKWYNVVPVDLTQDGVQVLDLVGSNLFHIGKAAVIVQDGKVSVDYDLFFGEGYVKDECVQWFTSLDDITTDFLNNPTSDVAFGQELSIADDLGGAETAILFICNRVTYRQPYNGDNGYLSRYWPNRQRWIDYRAELTELLEGMSK